MFVYKTSTQSNVTPIPASIRIAATVSLFFLAPFVGEFLLGNLPVNMFYLIPMLALLYGSGALLIRETAVRLNLDRGGVLLLCLVYGIIEEAFNTQSLFDPNYLGMHLLDYGYVPFLKMGSWWTVYVLGIHIVWSTAVPIALIDGLFPKTKNRSLLNTAGIIVVCLAFSFAAFYPLFTRPEQAFHASACQLISAAVAVIFLLFIAVFCCRRKQPGQPAPGETPAPLIMGLTALLLGSAFMSLTFLVTSIPAWLNIVGMIFCFTLACFLFVRWSKRSGWSARHSLMVLGGLLVTYIWYGFVQVPSIGNISPRGGSLGNILFSCFTIGLLLVAWRNTRIVNNPCD